MPECLAYQTDESTPYPRTWERRAQRRYCREDKRKKTLTLIDPSIRRGDARAKFKRLAEEWQKGTAIHSSMAKMATHPAYQKIIGMGTVALPFLFEQLKSEGDEPDHWFWALAAITDENPVPRESRGRIAEMAKAWLQWGRENGYAELA
jgi:hypothetical protein